MSKAVIQPFEEYQKGRIMFVQTVAELANRQKHIESLKSVGVMKLLGPLLSDPVISIKQSAALAIGRLAKHNKDLANSVVEDNGRIIRLLLEGFESNNKFYKKATCFVISSVARQSPKLAEEVCKYSAIKYLVRCLEEYDPSVKEAAVWALGYIAKHSAELAEKVSIEPNALEYLILCIQEPEINIKRITIQTISHIAKHNTTLTDRINVKDNLTYILFFLNTKDIALMYKICTCLANMARNSSSIATKIMSDVQPKQLIDCIENESQDVQKAAITLINEIASNPELATQVNEKISADNFIRFLKHNKGTSSLYGIPLISTMGKHKQEIAKKYVDEGVLDPLSECISKVISRLDRKKTSRKEDKRRDIDDNENHQENDTKATLACKAIGDLSKHSPEITRVIASHGNLAYSLLTLAITKELPEELKKSAQEALEAIIDTGDQLPPLNCLLDFTFTENDKKLEIDHKNHLEILVKLIQKQKELLTSGQLGKNEKREFLTKGSLEKILKLKKEPQYKKLGDEIFAFESIYSHDIVNFYDEEFAIKLKEKYLYGN